MASFRCSRPKGARSSAAFGASSSRRVLWTWRSGLTARTASPSGPSVDLSNERLQTPDRRLLLIGAAARPRQNADKLDKTRLVARLADSANTAMQAGKACHLTSGATSIFLRVAASRQASVPHGTSTGPEFARQYQA